MKNLKQIQKQAKKLKIRITKKSKHKRIYKTKKQLIKEIKMKNQKLKFGVKKIRFSDDTKKDSNNIILGKKGEANENRKKIVKKLLTDPNLRERQAENEKKISELIALVISEYEINDNIEFLILNELIIVYKSSKANSMTFFNKLELKYFSQAPYDKKNKVLEMFEHFKEFIELIVEIRTS